METIPKQKDSTLIKEYYQAVNQEILDGKKSEAAPILTNPSNGIPNDSLPKTVIMGETEQQLIQEFDEEALQKYLTTKINALRAKLILPQGANNSSQALSEISKIAAKRDLRFFYPLVFATLNPDDDFVYNWHLDYVAYMLQRTLPPDSGLNPTPKDQIKRIILNVPPRSGKSWELTAYRAFIFGHFPHERIISASYSNGLSLQLNEDTKKIIQAPWYKELFPDTKLVKEAGNFWTTTRNGESKCTSTGGTITGFGGNYIIADDMLNPEMSYSTTEIDKANRFCKGTLFGRVNNKQKAVRIVVMQRLHQNDLSGMLLNLNDKMPIKERWVHIKLPALATETKLFKFYDKQYLWYENTPLQPIRETKTDLEVIKIEQGPLTYAGQFQQEPVAEGGNIIDIKWFGRYNKLPEPNEITHIIQSWDTGIKDGKNNDPSVCLTFAVTKDGKYYLTNVFKQKMKFPQLRGAAIYQYDTFKANLSLIEDKGSGQSLIQELQDPKYKMNIIKCEPHKDKKERLNKHIFEIMAGRIYLPNTDYLPEPWVVDFEIEMAMFPNGSHDDQVDAVSQFLEFMRTYFGKKPRIRSLKVGQNNDDA